MSGAGDIDDGTLEVDISVSLYTLGRLGRVRTVTPGTLTGRTAIIAAGHFHRHLSPFEIRFAVTIDSFGALTGAGN